MCYMVLLIPPVDRCLIKLVLDRLRLNDVTSAFVCIPATRNISSYSQ